MALRVKWFRIVSAAAITISLLAACGQQPSSSGSGQQYKDQKTMVIDILKSDEGKKAVLSALGEDTSSSSGSEGAGMDSGGGGGQSDQGGGGGGGQSGGGKMKTLNTKDTQQLKMTVAEVIADPNNAQFLKSMMQDPKFAGQFAKAIKQENKKLQMEMIKDPEYQKQMLELMKNPEFESILMDTLKTVKSRQQMRMIVQDTLQSPLFKTELITLLKKAVEDQLKEPEKKGQKGGAGGGGGGGGGGGQDQQQDQKDQSDKKDDQSKQ